MARAPRRDRQGRSNGNSTPADSPPPPPSGSDRERIIAAFMGLLAERPIEKIERAEIAARAGVSLAALRGEFDSVLGILAAHIKEIDRAVLGSGDADMAGEPARERLFDALMRRIEALAPHKEAIRSLLHSLRRHPGLALAVNGLAVRSQRWTLTAAGFIVAGAMSWTLVEYLVHRYVLHGRFPDGKGWLEHGLHRFFDTAHGDHHLRPWDGLRQGTPR